MIERAGTSVCLSVTIVIVAAMILHRPVARIPDGTSPRQTSPPGTAGGEPPKAAAANDRPPARALSRVPDSALTHVRDGETFSDVARRVYGDSANLEAFWRMNRDQLATRDGEVHSGMVLRTPPL